MSLMKSMFKIWISHQKKKSLYVVWASLYTFSHLAVAAAAAVGVVVGGVVVVVVCLLHRNSNCQLFRHDPDFVCFSSWMSLGMGLRPL